MLGLSEMLHYGSPFWVHYDLTKGETGLVIPSDASNIRHDALNGRMVNDFRLVVLGFCYRVRHAAAGDGFRLCFLNDAATSPDGAGLFVIHECLGDAANARSEMSVNCFIAGDGMTASPLTQPDSIGVRKVGTPTSGSLTIWGMQIDGQTRLHKVYGGSPIIDLGG